MLLLHCPLSAVDYPDRGLLHRQTHHPITRFNNHDPSIRYIARFPSFRSKPLSVNEAENSPPAATDRGPADSRPPISATASSTQAAEWLRSNDGQQQLQTLLQQSKSNISIGAVQRLRASLGVVKTNLLLTIAQQHRDALSKLGQPNQPGTTWLVTDRGLQQSTDHLIAHYKAQRIPKNKIVFDVCCGIGGDAIALASRGPVIAIDNDPMMCHFAAHNLSISGATSAITVCQRAEQLLSNTDCWLHLDPDRRPHDDRRTTSAEQFNPNADVVARLLDDFPNSVVKLAPASEVPATWRLAAEREWISRGGQCRQQVLWCYEQPSTPSIRATTVANDGIAHSVCAPTAEIEASNDIRANAINEGEIGDWLFDLDPAIRAAGMTQWFAKQLGLQTLGGPAGFLTMVGLQLPTELVNGGSENWDRLVSPFRVVWSGSFNRKEIARELRARNCHSLEIKVRGVDVTPERLRPELLKPLRNKRTSTIDATEHSTFTLFVGSRANRQIYAALAQRLPDRFLASAGL